MSALPPLLPMVTRAFPRLQNPRFAKNVAGGLVSVGLPFSYLMYRHMGFRSSQTGKAQMVAHYLTFLASASVGIVLAHQTFFGAEKYTSLAKVSRFILAGLIPAAGFEGGGTLGRLLFPWQPITPSIKENPLQSQFNSFYKPVSNSVIRESVWQA